MFNEIIFLQILLLSLSFLFLFTTNNLLLWYVTGLILISLGLFLFINNNDIFVGFLWLIDLGVGLIFLIFIFHFSNFLYKKIYIKLNYYKYFIILLMLLVINLINFNDITSSIDHSLVENNTYAFLISYLNFYDIFLNTSKTDLNLLRELYFFNNSAEFILINFLVLYGVVQSIIFFFLLKKVFIYFNFNMLNVKNFFSYKFNFFYIRNQDLINQQDEGASLKIWSKKKNDSKKNFFKNVR